MWCKTFNDQLLAVKTVSKYFSYLLNIYFILVSFNFKFVQLYAKSQCLYLFNVKIGCHSSTKVHICCNFSYCFLFIKHTMQKYLIIYNNKKALAHIIEQVLICSLFKFKSWLHSIDIHLIEYQFMIVCIPSKMGLRVNVWSIILNFTFLHYSFNLILS